MLKAFWYSKPQMNRGRVINFGDELSDFLLQQISGKSVKWINPQKQNFFERTFTTHILSIGSILHFGAKNSLVWGSGLIERTSKAPNAKYFAVRGKHTRKELLNRKFKVPEIYGDPGLLTPRYFDFRNSNKKYKLGIIPHYVEFDEVNQWYEMNHLSKEFKMIDLRLPVQNVLRVINECEAIVSSSLHGIIVPQAYSIPTLRVSFTNKILGDGIKYADYFDSVGISHYDVPFVNEKDFNEENLLEVLSNNNKDLLIKKDLIRIQDDLLKAKPF
jgi:hypothetical protein